MFLLSLIIVKNPSLYQRTNRELGAGVEAAHAAAMGGPAIKNGGGGGVYPASSGAHEEHYAEGTKREREKDERDEGDERDEKNDRKERKEREMKGRGGALCRRLRTTKKTSQRISQEYFTP